MTKNTFDKEFYLRYTLGLAEKRKGKKLSAKEIAKFTILVDEYAKAMKELEEEENKSTQE